MGGHGYRLLSEHILPARSRRLDAWRTVCVPIMVPGLARPNVLAGPQVQGIGFHALEQLVKRIQLPVWLARPVFLLWFSQILCCEKSWWSNWNRVSSVLWSIDKWFNIHFTSVSYSLFLLVLFVLFTYSPLKFAHLIKFNYALNSDVILFYYLLRHI
jgi:hypothetical protein